ncbi:hypothetical protein [Halococcus sp. IIIV-5B]
MYENEQYIGEGIRESSVARDDIWLSTKTVQPVLPMHTDDT